MAEITDEMKNLLSKQKLGFVATVSPDNTPNLSPKGTIIVWNNDLIFADIKSPNTIANLKKNPSIEINVVDPLIRRGYRFKGEGKIISEGDEFQKIITHYKNEGIKSEIKSIVLVKVGTVNEVTSPLYDLGYSEEEIKTKWKKHYLSL
ncbi:MAG: pyridoxamine 5'-phosphate oxidase family protein [Nitrosopumilaceae archaeon]|nr:MAG: Flavin-nucleotide-binding protein [Nitrosopumilales archaeon]MCZ6583872.1 pyridoxamine 5'-phosphate oxidase family protein [Nitrososphaerota archaeon]